MTTIAHGTSETCRSVQLTLDVVGKRWSAAILVAIAQGATRFGEIRGAVDGISDRLLAARLKDLERHHLVERTVVPSMPVQVKYAPTVEGVQLVAAMAPLFQWGENHFGT
ncbi:hypothetical protein VV02_23515 [Luteipulveratus mongoliensis]|uniref:HTH hxlR-type domain-containing protein n=1 Tax=Luteipulveratus mongoliensis TaxID=571913 RepID=A0A0K1JRA6_9MICO|nr:hypothetical protein VV02_23515 [Luteipulveratus mongoliensis]